MFMPAHLSAPRAGLSSPLTGELRKAMAKADLRKPEPWREHVGQAIDRCRLMCGLSLKEFADAVGRDERQVARWMTGTERPQFDALFTVEALRAPLIIALAALAEDAQIVTTISIKRAG
jgi:DNA-binding transcriptional regulator YiaG